MHFKFFTQLVAQYRTVIKPTEDTLNEIDQIAEDVFYVS